MRCACRAPHHHNNSILFISYSHLSVIGFTFYISQGSSIGAIGGHSGNNILTSTLLSGIITGSGAGGIMTSGSASVQAGTAPARVQDQLP